MIEDCDLISAALHWDIDFLNEHLGDGDFSVYESSHHQFMYYDDKKVDGLPGFVPPTRRTNMKFPEFVAKIRQNVPSDKR